MSSAPLSASFSKPFQSRPDKGLPPNGDENSGIYFKHSPKPIDKKLVLKLSNGEYYRFSPQILKMYFQYRDAVFTSYTVYREKGILHQDILDFKKQRRKKSRKR